MKKVFITGMGAITSLGNGTEEMFNGLLQGKSGIRSYPEWAQYKGLHTHLGAPAPAYDIMKVPRSARRTMSRMSEMGTLATMEALQQADLALPKADDRAKDAPRILLCLGSTTGSPDTMETYFRKLFEKGGPEGQLSTNFFKVMNHSATANVAAAIGFYGAALAPSSACASSAQAMILGWEMIQSGLYDIVIAGGADELHYTSAAIFDIVLAASRSYNDRPDLASRPFDQDRDGLVVSEGAGVVILESEASVHRRGVRPLARFMGGAYLCNGSHMSQSDASTMADVMGETLARAGLERDKVGYLNAHATSTMQGDQAEAEAIASVFSNRVPVTSFKGNFGHSLAACGAIEVIGSTMMLSQGVILPTRNLTNVDPACAGIRHVQERTSTSARTFMSNNFAFGGVNTSLLVSLDL